MRRSLLWLCLLLSASLTVEQRLTNGDVVKLVKAGLSVATIQSKIASSATQFDTSTDALVALAKDGVPDEIIRAMIGRLSVMPPAEAGPAAASVRRYEVAIHRSKHAKCDGAEFRIDRSGVKAARCRDIDFTLTWKEVKSVCYEYGFRGVVEFRTASASHRISTTTPAEAKRIVETIRDLNPSLSRLEGCREK